MNAPKTRPGLIWELKDGNIVIPTPASFPDIVLDWVIVHEMKRRLDEVGR